MAHGAIRKQPSEVMDYSLDFSPDLDAEETITLVSCTATNRVTGADSSAAVISSAPAPAVSGQTVIFWLKNGLDGERHNISIKVESSKGRKCEGDLDVFIVEEK